MNYKEYIKLGFKRTDMSDSLEFNRSGYYGFCLTKHISDKMMVEVSSEDLGKPKLYIKKRGSETYHIVLIPTEAVIDLFTNDETFEYTYTAC
jgi:hypothetical protein